VPVRLSLSHGPRTVGLTSTTTRLKRWPGSTGAAKPSTRRPVQFPGLSPEIVFRPLSLVAQSGSGKDGSITCRTLDGN